MTHEKNPNFLHHHPRSPISNALREVVFGVEDGMVSTLGALTGIAIGTQNHFAVVLSGFVIVAVESLSMGIGSYISNKSVHELTKRKLDEERYEIKKFRKEEILELERLYIADGFEKKLAQQMARAAARKKKLFLKEMAYRELKVFPAQDGASLKDGLTMYVSYIVGGLIPLTPYLFLPLASALLPSVFITLFGLFTLGVFTTRYTKRNWFIAGIEMLLIAGLAVVIGSLVGKLGGKFSV